MILYWCYGMQHEVEEYLLKMNSFYLPLNWSIGIFP
jgi:hypothetical protein